MVKLPPANDLPTTAALRSNRCHERLAVRGICCHLAGTTYWPMMERKVLFRDIQCRTVKRTLSLVKAKTSLPSSYWLTRGAQGCCSLLFGVLWHDISQSAVSDGTRSAPATCNTFTYQGSWRQRDPATNHRASNNWQLCLVFRSSNQRCPCMLRPFKVGHHESVLPLFGGAL